MAMNSSSARPAVSPVTTAPLVSDDSYHATGVPQNPDFYTSPLKQITFRYEQAAKGVPEEVYRTTDQDLGLYYVTKQEIDKGKFRTPSLRDLCYTSPLHAQRPLRHVWKRSWPSTTTAAANRPTRIRSCSRWA